MYYRARYYDPAVGRFTQRDPIGLAGGLNLYGYVGGDPINRVDPWGLENILVPGSDVSGKRDNGWYQTGSEFDRAFRMFTGETSSRSLRWGGGNTAEARTMAARDLATMVNSVPLHEKVHLFAHSHGGNVVAEASKLFKRPVELVVTAGTPVRPDYTFDMSHIRQGVAVSSPNDLLQVLGGNALTVPGFGEVGFAGRDRTEYAFTNVRVPEIGSHDEFHKEFSVTIGAVDNTLRGSATAPVNPESDPYAGHGTGLVPMPLPGK
jgi:pimeloyl-ACP methyl ester carboxylesterase